MNNFGPVATGWILKESLATFARRLWVILGINALIYAPLALLYDSIYWWDKQRIEHAESLGLPDADVLFSIFDGYLLMLQIIMSLLIGPLAYAATAFAINDHYRQNKPSIKSSIARAFKLTNNLVKSATLYALAVTLGLVLFIIPSFYLGVLFYLTYQVVALEQVSGRPALKRSQELLKGNMWTAFFIIFALIIASIPYVVIEEFVTAGPVYVILSTVTGIILYAFMGVVSAVLYFACRAQKKAPLTSLNDDAQAREPRPI